MSSGTPRSWKRRKGSVSICIYEEQTKNKKNNFKVTEEEIEEAYKEVDPKLVEIIRKALLNIRTYHEKQRQYSWFDSNPAGTILGQQFPPLRSVGE